MFKVSPISSHRGAQPTKPLVICLVDDMLLQPRPQACGNHAPLHKFRSATSSIRASGRLQYEHKQESLANAKVARDSLARQKADFDVKLALKVILGHLFCNQLQADKG